MNKEYININDENITLSLTFAPIEIIKDNKTVNETYKIYFYISGLLYKRIDGSEELINTTSILYEKNTSYENQTKKAITNKGIYNSMLEFFKHNPLVSIISLISSTSSSFKPICFSSSLLLNPYKEYSSSLIQL